MGKKSEVWKYVDKLDKGKIKCKRCGKTFTDCKNTSNAWNHLKIHGISRTENETSETSAEQVF